MKNEVQYRIPDSVKETLLLVREGESVVKQCEQTDLNLVIGLTGAGKTSFINTLMDVPMSLDKAKKLSIASDFNMEEAVSAGKAGQIGHGSESQTLFPTVYQTSDGINFLDCAGFGENRSRAHRLAVNYCLEEAVKKARSIQNIFVVVNYHSLVGARGEQFKNLVSMLAKIFNDIDLFESNVHFVFSHCNEVWAQSYLDVWEKNPLLNAEHIYKKTNEEVLSLISGMITSIAEDYEKKAETFWKKLKRKAGKTLSPFNVFSDTSEMRDDISPKFASQAIQICALLNTALRQKQAYLFNAHKPAFLSALKVDITRYILTPIKKTPLSKQALNFSDYDMTRSQFEEELSHVTAELLEVLYTLNHAPKTLAEYDENIKALQSYVDSIDLEIAASQAGLGTDGDNTFKRHKELRRTLDGSAEQLRRKQAEVDEKKEKCNTLIRELEKLDSDELVERKVFDFSEPRWWFLGLPLLMCQSNKTFSTSNPEAPYVDYRVVTDEKGNSWDITKLPRSEARQKGKLSIHYQSEVGTDGLCQIYMTHQKRFYLDNPRKIMKLRDEIASLNDIIQGLEREHDALMSAHTALLDTLISETSTIHEANKKLRQLKNDYLQSLKGLAHKKDILLQTIRHYEHYYSENQNEFSYLNSLLGMIKGSFSAEFQATLNEYITASSHQTQTLPRKESYISDWTDREVNLPVKLTACGHIVDFEELKRYLTDSADEMGKPCLCCLRHSPREEHPRIELGNMSRYKLLLPSLESSAQDEVGHSTEEEISQLEAQSQALQASLQSIASRLVYLRRLIRNEASQSDTQADKEDQKIAAASSVRSTEMTAFSTARTPSPRFFSEEDKQSDTCSEEEKSSLLTKEV